MQISISKDLLKKKGLNMTTLAEKVGLSRGELYTAIKNKTMNAETITLISNVLEVDSKEWLGELTERWVARNLSTEEFVIPKDLLRKKGLNMTTLAEKVGMSRGGLYTAIKNKTLNTETLILIANMLDIDSKELRREYLGDLNLLPDFKEMEILKLNTELVNGKELNKNLQESYDILSAKYDNLLKISSLNEKLAESANKRALLSENTFFLVYRELQSLSDIAKPYIKANIKLNHPELADKKDPKAFLKYTIEDNLNAKIESIVELIMPLVKMQSLELT